MAKKVKHYSYTSPHRHRVRVFALVIIAIILILAASAFYARKVYYTNLEAVSGSDSSILVTIPEGSSLTQIAKILKQAGVIRSTWAFEWYVRNDNYSQIDLEAGTYLIHTNSDVQQIVTQISEGKQSGKLVVILPGQRIDQVEQALINDGFSKSDVVSALNPDQYISKYPMLAGLPASATLEGYLYPDSFAKDSSTQVNQIINESLEEMQDNLTLQTVNGFNKQGLTIFQGVTLASIVGQEVSNQKDKPIVAQIFLSRLKTGMPLGSDATAFYGAIEAGQTPSISYNSPYNTRINTGLPPGPISNVTSSDLEAVANPANTNYLYFVTGDNGVTYYSTTLDQHNQQTAQYCKKLCSSE